MANKNWNSNTFFSELFKNAESNGENKSIRENMDNLCEMLEEEIIKSDSSEDEKKGMLKKLRKFSNTKTNLMLVGATGCGKSSKRAAVSISPAAPIPQSIYNVFIIFSPYD